MKSLPKKSGPPREQRSGAAAVEFAVCLPLILTLLLATLQATQMFYLKQSLTVAAYEGIRKCVEYRSSPADVQAACNAIFADRRVNGAVVTISPANYATQPRESWITVTVTAPRDANTPLTGWFAGGTHLSASATMMKEF